MSIFNDIYYQGDEQVPKIMISKRALAWKKFKAKILITFLSKMQNKSLKFQSDYVDMIELICCNIYILSVK